MPARRRSSRDVPVAEMPERDQSRARDEARDGICLGDEGRWARSESATGMVVCLTMPTGDKGPWPARGTPLVLLREVEQGPASLMQFTFLASFCQNPIRLPIRINIFRTIKTIVAILPNRRRESQICVARALAVHTGPSPQVAGPYRTKLLQTCAAPSGRDCTNLDISVTKGVTISWKAVGVNFICVPREVILRYGINANRSLR
jgi:hypothetical protein